MERLPDEVIEIFEQHSGASTVRRTPSSSVEIRPQNTDFVGAEFTRQVGKKLLDRGYIITAVREFTTSNCIEVWVDDVSERVKSRSIAARAAEILRSPDDTEYEPSNRESDKEQYVDVFPEPHDDAMMDWSIAPSTMEQLHDAGIEIRAINCGTSTVGHRDAEYRVWFEPIDGADDDEAA